MITISVCMIVKNEENVLARCLDSLKDLADEIVIVDTGSVDRTKEIAAEYTELIYDFAWIDDFSAARNFAFSKCSMEYIYSADADEVLDEENQKRFSLLKQAMLPEVEVVQMYYLNRAGDYNTTGNFEREYRPKLYRRLRRFVWEDPIHETVRLEPVVFDSDIEILHMPEAAHGGRDLALLKKTAYRSPAAFCQDKLAAQGKAPAAVTGLSKKLHHMYAMELYIAGTDQDFLDAEEFFMRSQEDGSRTLEEVMEACCAAAHAARLRKDTALFFKSAMKAVAGGSCSEICCELGEYYDSVGDDKEAYLWFYNAAAETESILDIRTSGEIPRKRLSELCRRDGREEEALEWERQIENFLL